MRVTIGRGRKTQRFEITTGKNVPDDYAKANADAILQLKGIKRDAE